MNGVIVVVCPSIAEYGIGTHRHVSGLAIGVVGALALARVMSSFVFGISVYDPLTLAVVVLVLTGVATVACLIPARRATRIDPIAALRFQ